MYPDRHTNCIDSINRKPFQFLGSLIKVSRSLPESLSIFFDKQRRQMLAVLAQAAPHRRPQFGGLYPETAQESGNLTACVDTTKSCKGWAEAGECERNPTFMLEACRSSCTRCSLPDPSIVGRVLNYISSGASEKPLAVWAPERCSDDPSASCVARQATGECTFHTGDMLMRCPQSCGVCGYWTKLRKAYDCTDTHRMCATWSGSGECENNPGCENNSAS